jgi:hypothetical protein
LRFKQKFLKKELKIEVYIPIKLGAPNFFVFT